MNTAASGNLLECSSDHITLQFKTLQWVPSQRKTPKSSLSRGLQSSAQSGHPLTSPSTSLLLTPPQPQAGLTSRRPGTVFLSIFAIAPPLLWMRSPHLLQALVQCRLLRNDFPTTPRCSYLRLYARTHTPDLSFQLYFPPQHLEPTDILYTVFDLFVYCLLPQ